MSLPSIHDLPITPGQLTGLLVLAGIVAANLANGRKAWTVPAWEHAFGLAGFCLVLDGQYYGLVDAPREAMMGDVGRILYVHVPTAWSTMVTFGASMVAAILYLVTSRRIWDHVVEAAAEVGVAVGVVLLITGMMFAKPTWGVYWTWDPRLISSAVMVLAYIGVLTLRSFLDDPERRATWTAVGSILSATSMFVTYMSVRWWPSVHQMQSTPKTIDPEMVLVMRMNAWAMLFLVFWMVVRRVRIGRARAAEDEAPPLPPAAAPA